MTENTALQVYSVREEMEKDFCGTLKKVKEMGYDGVEFAGLYGNDPQDVRKMCDEIGLVPISAHVSYNEIALSVEETLACYHAIGCRYVVLPSLPAERRPGGALFAETVAKIREIGQAAKKYGMVLQYHNHDFEFERVDGKFALDVLYETVSPDLLQTQLDTCWVNVAGVDPCGYVRKYSGRIPTVHLKDFAGSRTENMYNLIGVDEGVKKDTGGKFEFRPLGKGVQDIPAIVEAAKKGGAEWFIVEQDEPSMGYTALECAQISAAYLKGI